MKKYGGRLAALGAGLVLLCVSIIEQWNTANGSVREYIRIFSNAALVPGVLLTGVGLMVKISDTGFFDGIRYGVGRIFEHLRGKEKRYVSYYDYVKRERKQRQDSLLVAGIIYLSAAVALTGAYYLV